MKKWIRSLTSLLMSALITFNLGVTALAGSEESTDSALPAEASEETPVSSPGEEPKVEEPKAQEPKVEAPKTEAPKAEGPKAQEPKAQEPKAEEPKAEEPKVEEPKVEEPKVEEPKVEEPKVEEPKTEEPKAEEPKAEEPKVEEPKAEESKVEEPKAEEPKNEEPKAEEPKAEEPKAEEPKTEEPKVEEPKVEEPKVEEPKAEEPKTEEPKAEEPKVEEPKVEEPKAEEPKVEEPKNEEPKAEEPKAEDPNVEEVAEAAAPMIPMIALARTAAPAEDAETVQEPVMAAATLAAVPSSEEEPIQDSITLTSSLRSTAPTLAAAATTDSAASSSSEDVYYTIKDGSHVMVNHTGGSYSAADGKDLTILASGLNHVDSISGTGAVKIGGSGILLVDNMDDSVVDNLELMSFTDMYGEKGGSVAVFRRIDEGTYQLVNGSVPGVLDEEYKLDNIMLIVPEGSTLTIGTIGAVQNPDGTYTYYTGSNSGASNWDNIESAGRLIIGDRALLILDGTLNMVQTDSRVVDGSILSSLGIEGSGKVLGNGAVSGGSVEISDSTSGTMAYNVSESSTAPVLTKKDGDTSSLTKTVGNKTVLDTQDLASKLSGFGSTERLVIELRRKYSSGRIISNRFTPTDIPKDVTVADSEAEGELIVWELPEGKEPDFWDNLDPSNWQVISGTSIVSTIVSATGSGILGGTPITEVYDPNAPGAENVITVTIGGTTYATEGRKTTPTAPSNAPTRRLDAAPRADWRAIVSKSGAYYELRIYNGAAEIANPGVKMTARMKFTLPEDWDADTIYAVFRSANGKLTACKATYDAKEGTLRFSTDLTGTFALISFPFEGTPYSDAFYEALAQLELIAALPVRR